MGRRLPQILEPIGIHGSGSELIVAHVGVWHLNVPRWKVDACRINHLHLLLHLLHLLHLHVHALDLNESAHLRTLINSADALALSRNRKSLHPYKLPLPLHLHILRSLLFLHVVLQIVENAVEIDGI